MMTMTITDESMSSDATVHTARAVPGGWEVSWLPGRVLDRNKAITALMLAETIASSSPVCARGIVDMWAAELGLPAAEAVALASADGVR